LKLEIIKKALVIVNILITFRFGVMAMVMGQAVLSVVCVAINAWPNRRLLDYSFFQQVQDILPAFLLSAGMGAIVFALDWVIANDYLLLGTQIVIGAAIYLAGAKVFGMESSEYLWRTGYQSLMPKIKRFA
jgi:peptidoglycan biosynthesis protein MviN/MurJ (putative lipid II flippase)